VFHLRRGDTSQADSGTTDLYCDTSVERVVEYMRCASRATTVIIREIYGDIRRFTEM